MLLLIVVVGLMVLMGWRYGKLRKKRWIRGIVGGLMFVFTVGRAMTAIPEIVAGRDSLGQMLSGIVCVWSLYLVLSAAKPGKGDGKVVDDV